MDWICLYIQASGDKKGMININKELIELLEKGVIDTDEDFEIFYGHSDDVITDIYNGIQITDIRIYLSKDKSVFCEIYADIEYGFDEDIVKNIDEKQKIRYFMNCEDGYSYEQIRRHIE